MEKKLKYAIYGVLALIVVIAALYVYRLFFMFDKKRVKSYAEEAAKTFGDPNAAYLAITEMVQSILKSQDETAAVRALALAEKIDKEQKLVNTALYKCYSLGFLELPQIEA
jgi:3-methyladenine DNA glycosylase AlkD